MVLHRVEVAAHCESPSYLYVLAVVVKFLKYVGLVVVVCVGKVGEKEGGS